MNEKNMITAKRIKQCRLSAAETLDQIGQLVGVHKTTVRRWETGETERISLPIIQTLATHYNVSPAWLMGADVPMGKDKKQKKDRTSILIPVLGRVQAGYPTEAVENILDYEEISEEMARSGELFALKVKGDSMEPKFSEGDVVIVRKQADVDNGDIAIMLVNGDEATIKKIQKFKGGINLIPSNSSYEVITYSNKEIIEKPVVCIGKVVELRAKF